MNSPENISIPAVALLLGIPPALAFSWAASGRFGALDTPPGHQRYRTVRRDELEARFGPFDDAQVARAIERYVAALEKRTPAEIEEYPNKMFADGAAE